MNVIYKKILLKIEKDSVGVAGFEPAAFPISNRDAIYRSSSIKFQF
jgi:hypothetical protein